MDISSLLLSFLVVLVIPLVAKFIVIPIKSLPPGPPSVPILGHLHLLGKLPHRSLQDLSLRYGPLMHLRLGCKSITVASSAEMARTFLKTHDQNFASRRRFMFGKLVAYDHMDIGFAQYGEHWRQMKKICTQQLFTQKRMAESIDVLKAEIRMLMDSIKSSHQEGKIINMATILSCMTARTITQITLGGKVFESQAVADHFKESSREMFFLAGVFNLGDYLPFLSWLDLQGYQRRMKRAYKQMDVVLQCVVEEHLQKNCFDQNHDLVDVLLRVGGLSHNKIKACVMDILIGGTDTTSGTIEWALAELIRAPHILEKAQNEICSIVGTHRMVEESDLPNLHYFDSIVKETLRLHPAAPLLVPHESIEDCKVEGFTIPKKTSLIVNVWAIGRDPKTWDEPEMFNPERFIGSNKDIRGQDFELLPFGSGRRMCPGWNLGLCMIQLTLANLLHSFNWSLPAGQSAEDLNMSESFGTTMPMAVPLQLRACPRH